MNLVKRLECTSATLQDTRLKASDPRMREFERLAFDANFHVHFAPCPEDRAAGGTAILVARTFRDSSELTFSHGLAGGYCVCEFSHAATHMKLFSVYAPHNSRRARHARSRFFKSLASKITPTSILTGDFNCVLDLDLDLRRDAMSPYDNSGSDELMNIVTKNRLNDEMRASLGLHFEFTMHSTTQHGTCRSRIDRSYTPVVPDAHWTSIIQVLAGSPSDHEAGTLVELEIRSETNPRGRDLKTLNAELILEPSINAKCAGLIKKASDALENAPNKGALLASLLHDTRKVLAQATRKFRKKGNIEIAEIRARLASLHSTTAAMHRTSRQDIQKRADLEALLQSKLNTLNPPKPRQALHRTRREENMTSDFWKSAYHSNHSASFINSLAEVGDWNNPPPKDANPSKVTAKVAEEAAKYLEYLGTPPPDTPQSQVATDRLTALLRKWGVNEDTSKTIGAPITEKEVAAIAASVPPKKSPGPDRIPNEWYRAFANQLAPILTAAYNEAHAAGKFPKGFADGLVSLIYKKKGLRSDIRNYRPITLLNGHYKIFTRVLAKRWLNIVTQFVSSAQIGFMPRTLIGEASMFLNLLKAHLDSVDEGGLLCFLDLEKAFDKVSWAYLHKATEALRFTPEHRRWTDILYDLNAPPRRRVYANGHLSPPYTVARGTAQGCPLSPLLFLVVVEGLTRMVTENPNIKGLSIGPHTFKIRHFADDTFAMLRDKHDLSAFNLDLQVFFEATGMAENLTKRDYIALGVSRYLDFLTLPGNIVTDAATGQRQNTSWTPEGSHLITLGVPFGNGFDVRDWWKAKIRVAKSSLTNVRGLSAMGTAGRIKLAGANYLGRFRYWFESLTVPKDIIHAMMSDYIVFITRKNPEQSVDELGSKGRGRPLVAKSSRHLSIREGGGGMIDLKSHITAFQARWILRYIEPREADWKLIFDHWIGGRQNEHSCSQTSRTTGGRRSRN